MKSSLLSVVAITMVLVSCASPLVPDTFNKAWAEAQQTDTAVLANALTLAQAGKITKVQLKKIEDKTDSAKSGLDLARQLHKTNPIAGQDRLTEIMNSLLALQTALSSPEVAGELTKIVGN